MLRKLNLLKLLLIVSVFAAQDLSFGFEEESTSPAATDTASAEESNSAATAQPAEKAKPVEPVNPEKPQYQAEGAILAVRGSSLVLTSEESDGLVKGGTFEVYVELPQGLGTAIIAEGRIVTAEEGLLIGKITSKDKTAKISKEMKVRFLKAKTATESPEMKPESPPSKTTRTVKKVVVPELDGLALKGFRATVDRYKRAVLLVKDSQNKSHGTAFVISKEHRLLATNAHVADIAQTVVLNETRTEYKVMRRWFHPDTLRRMREDNQTLIRSGDPNVGSVDVTGTDLALLQLEMIGPDLPAEVILAHQDEAKTIIGAEIGMYGFPAYNTQAASGQFAQATFVKGTVSRLERLNGHPQDQRVEDRRRVVYSGPNYPGFSGSPIFLENGRVVVVNHALTNLKDGTKVAYGIRVDALWDMLSHYKLADKIANVPEELPEPVFIVGENPQVKKLQTAINLMAQAREAHKQRQFEKCFTTMSEAEKIAPWYWEIYLVRAKMVDDYVKVVNLTREEQAQCYEASLSYYAKADELHLKSFNIRALPILLDYARQSINVARFRENKEVLKKAIEVLDDPKVVKVAFEGKNAAYFLALRATVKKDLGTMNRKLSWFQGALADIDEAIKRQPGHAAYEKERNLIIEQAQKSGVVSQ